MRTWTVVFPPPIGSVWVRAYDAPEAAERILAAAGLEPQPCCYLEEPPCELCRKDADLEAEENAYDHARDAAMLEEKP